MNFVKFIIAVLWLLTMLVEYNGIAYVKNNASNIGQSLATSLATVMLLPISCLQ